MSYYVVSPHSTNIRQLDVRVNRRTSTTSGRNDETALSQRIKTLREERGWNQAELARRVGIKQPSLWLIESGSTKTLRADTLMRLSAALGVSPYYLWAGFGDKSAPVVTDEQEIAVVETYRRLSETNQTMYLKIGSALFRSQAALPQRKSA